MEEILYYAHYYKNVPERFGITQDVFDKLHEKAKFLDGSPSPICLVTSDDDYDKNLKKGDTFLVFRDKDLYNALNAAPTYHQKFRVLQNTLREEYVNQAFYFLLQANEEDDSTMQGKQLASIILLFVLFALTPINAITKIMENNDEVGVKLQNYINEDKSVFDEMINQAKLIGYMLGTHKWIPMDPSIWYTEREHTRNNTPISNTFSLLEEFRILNNDGLQKYFYDAKMSNGTRTIVRIFDVSYNGAAYNCYGGNKDDKIVIRSCSSVIRNSASKYAFFNIIPGSLSDLYDYALTIPKVIEQIKTFETNQIFRDMFLNAVLVGPRNEKEAYGFLESAFKGVVKNFKAIDYRLKKFYDSLFTNSIQYDFEYEDDFFMIKKIQRNEDYHVKFDALKHPFVLETNTYPTLQLLLNAAVLKFFWDLLKRKTKGFIALNKSLKTTEERNNRFNSIKLYVEDIYNVVPIHMLTDEQLFNFFEYDFLQSKLEGELWSVYFVLCYGIAHKNFLFTLAMVAKLHNLYAFYSPSQEVRKKQSMATEASRQELLINKIDDVYKVELDELVKRVRSQIDKFNEHNHVSPVNIRAFQAQLMINISSVVA